MSAGITELPLQHIVPAQSSLQSIVLAEGIPTAGFVDTWEIWRTGLAADTAFSEHNLEPQAACLEPPLGGVAPRWFTVAPQNERMWRVGMREVEARTFQRIGAADCHRERPNPAMHQIASLDSECLRSGSTSRVLVETEGFLLSGDVVVQQGTAHAWRAYAGPELSLAVLIDRRSPLLPSSGETN